MIKNLVENYVEACNQLEDATGVILFPEKLQCTTEGFLRLVEQYGVKLEISTVEDNQYPYKASVEIEGFRFFTIWSQKEYENYMKGRVA